MASSPTERGSFVRVPTSKDGVRALIDALDAGNSPLGPYASWPERLKGVVSVMTPAQAQIVLFWGDELVALYNDAYAPTIGDKHPQAFGRPGVENWRELWDDLEPLLRTVIATGDTIHARDRPFYIERHGFGEEVNFDISYSPVFNKDGTVGGVLCIVNETTDRVRAERRAIAERERLAEMFRQAPGFMALLEGPDHVFTLTNAAYEQLIGRGDVIGKPIREALPDISGQGYFELLDGVYRTGEPFAGHGVSVSFLPEPGAEPEERLVDYVFQPVRRAGGEITGVFVQGVDVTVQMRAIEARRESEARLRLAVEAAAIGTFDFDPVAGKLSWDDRCKSLFGITIDREVDIDDAFFAGLHPDDREPIRMAVERALDPAGDGRYDVEYRTVGLDDGVTRWIAAKGRATFEDGRAARFIGTVIDVTARKRQEAALETSEAALQALNRTLETRVEERTRERDRIWRLSRDPFLVSDAEGRWLSVSPAWTEILGWTPHELIGRTSEWMEHPDDREKTRAEIVSLAAGDTTFRFENRFRTREGDYRWFSWTAVPEGDLLYCVARDVTGEKDAADALRNAEDALRQAQKMETVGQLTGGVAHDFNNLLQIVTGNLEILQRNLPEDAARLRRSVDNAMTGARRAATLTQRLLAFSRRSPLDPKRVDVNRLVAGMSELLGRTLGETIAVETIASDGVWAVEADPNQLENAILNLAVNARDAMPNGGVLRIETENVTFAKGETEAAPGAYVAIRVSDTGAGMAPDILKRAFEPFFTTKEVGKGTGLGLSMVYGFAKQSGGLVAASSKLGEGTTVSLVLPRHLGVEPPEPEQPGPAAIPSGAGDETVLVCEDDEAVRAYSAGALRELGYRVLEAADAAAALEVIRTDASVDLLFTDVVLPGGVTGAVLADRARALRPDLRVLFTTGYARDAIVHHGRLDPGVELLAKPYGFSDLAAKIRGVLDAPGRAD